MSDYIKIVYDEKRAPKTDYPSKLAAYLLKRFKIAPGARLLELGCGRGEFLKAFQNLGLECQGVDSSSYCKENEPGLKVDCLDLSNVKFPYPDNFFDVVYHKSFLEHFYSPDKIMQETLRVLKPQGKLIILTPDWVSQTKVFYEDYTHCRPYTVLALSDMLKISGFLEVEAQLFCQYPAIWKFPAIKLLSAIMRIFISVPLARKITGFTGIKYFRWSVELMVLGYGKKGALR